MRVYESESLQRAPLMRRVAFVVLAVLSVSSSHGCAATRQGQPPLSITISLSRDEFRIGEPLIATIRIENRGDERVVLPRFDHDAVQFITGRKGVAQRIYREPVHSGEVIPQPREIAPHQAVSRDFLFTQATCEAGECAIIAKLKANKAFVGSTVLTEAIYAEPVQYRVVEDIALRRGIDGLVLKEQALELARTWAPGPVIGERAVLVPLGESGLVTWIVMLTVRQPDGKELNYVVQVNPYTGKLRPLERNDATDSPLVPNGEAQKIPATQSGAESRKTENNAQQTDGGK